MTVTTSCLMDSMWLLPEWTEQRRRDSDPLQGLPGSYEQEEAKHSVGGFGVLDIGMKLKPGLRQSRSCEFLKANEEIGLRSTALAQRKSVSCSAAA